MPQREAAPEPAERRIATATAAELDRRHDRCHDYRDVTGAVVMRETVRRTASGKRTALWRPVGGDVFEALAPDAPPDGWPLYRLPELMSSPSSADIWTCEGAKDADALASLGFVTVASVMGAGSATRSDWRQLAGRNVYIVPDRDDPGERYARDVAALAHAAGAAFVGIVRPGADDAPTGYDVADWIADGADAATIRSAPVEVVDPAALPVPTRPAPTARGPFVQLPPGVTTPYGQHALDDEHRILAALDDGRRRALPRAAVKLWQLVAGGELDAADMTEALLDACERNGYIGKYGRRDAERTIERAQAVGMAKLRKAPSRDDGHVAEVCGEVRARLEDASRESGMTPKRRRMIAALVDRCEAAGRLRIPVALDALALDAGCARSTVRKALADDKLAAWWRRVTPGGTRKRRRLTLDACVVELRRPPKKDFGRDARTTTSRRENVGAAPKINAPVSGATREPQGDRPNASAFGLDVESESTRLRVLRELQTRPAGAVVVASDLDHVADRRRVRDELDKAAALDDPPVVRVEPPRRAGRGRPPTAAWSAPDAAKLAAFVDQLARDLAAAAAAADAKRRADYVTRRENMASVLATVNEAAERSPRVCRILDDARRELADRDPSSPPDAVPWSAVMRAKKAADDEAMASTAQPAPNARRGDAATFAKVPADAAHGAHVTWHVLRGSAARAHVDDDIVEADRGIAGPLASAAGAS